MRISDWSSDVCSSDLTIHFGASYSHRLSFGTLSALANGSNSGDVTVGLGLTFSFGFDSQNRPFVTADRIAERGALAPFVYYDHDSHGRYAGELDTRTKKRREWEGCVRTG